MKQPHVILIMTDQQRADALGMETPEIQTPCLDWLARTGTRFTQAYSECPVCIPARRTLMTGTRPATHGVVHNYETWLNLPTLPETFRQAGYQTQLCGKLHLWPLRKHYGFEGMDLSDGPGASRQEGDSDYIRFMRREAPDELHAQIAHGVQGESCHVRPWHLEERLHHTNWVTDRAIDFIERRDPTRPFFLNISYFQPHPPLTPPAFFFERYLRRELPAPVEAEWSRLFGEPQKGLPGQNPRQYLGAYELQEYRAAYYAAISHIDNQIRRLFNTMEMMDGLDPDDMVILFASDHGDMLGDHQWIRKCLPYQGSVHVPFILRLPRSRPIGQGVEMDAPVGLQDVMPTLLDSAGIGIPETVEGQSAIPLVEGKGTWRSHLHGEISAVPETDSGMHYLTDGREKYVWFPGLGKEQFFDLTSDPGERLDKSSEPWLADRLKLWRGRLVEELRSRPEGFVQDGQLATLAGPTPLYLPGSERDTDEFNDGVESTRLPQLAQRL